MTPSHSVGDDALPNLEKGTESGPAKPVFHIECIDFRKDGSRSLNDGRLQRSSFSEMHLDQLIKAAPAGNMRIIAAQRIESTKGRELPTWSPCWSIAQTSQSLQHVMTKDERRTVDFHAKIWEQYEPALFRQMLRFAFSKQFIDFHDHFELDGILKQDTDSRSHYTVTISFIWVSSTPEHLVGLMVFPDVVHTWKENPSRSFVDWIIKNCSINHQVTEEINSLQTLGCVFLLDFLIFLTSKWIKGLRRELGLPPWCIKTDQDGLPTAQSFVSQTDHIAEKTTLLLERLGLSSGTGYRGADTNFLEFKAEDLAVRTAHMTQLASQLQDSRLAKYNDTIVRANLRESRAVRRLAILASVFLPLTLSATILNIQKRFLDIHQALWDFAALSLDISLIALLLFGVMTPRGRSILGKVQHHTGRTLWWLLLVPAAVTGVGINYGMFASSQIAWKIIAIGLPASVGFGVMMLMARLASTSGASLEGPGPL